MTLSHISCHDGAQFQQTEMEALNFRIHKLTSVHPLAANPMEICTDGAGTVLGERDGALHD